MKRFLSILLFLCVASTCYGWSIGSSGYDEGATGPTEFGFTGIANRAVVCNNAKFFYMEYTPSTSGTVTYVHLYCRYTNGYGRTLGIYDSSGNILAYGNDTGNSNDQWANQELNTEVEVSSSATYYIGGIINRTGIAEIKGTDPDAGKNVLSIAMTYGATLSNADFSSPSTENDNANMSIYFDNQSGDPV